VVDYWVIGEIMEFDFDNNSEFPIRSYINDAIQEFYGEPIYVYYIYLQFRISFIDPAKKAVPYMQISNGYFHRSKTILKSGHPILSYSELKIKGGYGSLLGLGLDYKINKRLRVFVDFSLLDAETYPVNTSLSIWSIGILFR
jgi:hypothetical protein